jgi:hypothetical protein
MASEPVSVRTSVEPNERTNPHSHRGYALSFFLIACIWFVVVTVLLFLSAFSIAHVPESVLIAAIAVIPALFVIFGLLLPGPPTRPHFSNFERDPQNRQIPNAGLVSASLVSAFGRGPAAAGTGAIS